MARTAMTLWFIKSSKRSECVFQIRVVADFFSGLRVFASAQVPEVLDRLWTTAFARRPGVPPRRRDRAPVAPPAPLHSSRRHSSDCVRSYCAQSQMPYASHRHRVRVEQLFPVGMSLHSMHRVLAWRELISPRRAKELPRLAPDFLSA